MKPKRSIISGQNACSNSANKKQPQGKKIRLPKSRNKSNHFSPNSASDDGFSMFFLASTKGLFLARFRSYVLLSCCRRISRIRLSSVYLKPLWRDPLKGPTRTPNGHNGHDHFQKDKKIRISFVLLGNMYCVEEIILLVSFFVTEASMQNLCSSRQAQV